MTDLQIVRIGILPLGMVNSHLVRPPFEDDPRAVGLALQRLLDSEMERFHLGHGGPLRAREVQHHAQTLMAIKKEGWPAITPF